VRSTSSPAGGPDRPSNLLALRGVFSQKVENTKPRGGVPVADGNMDLGTCTDLSICRYTQHTPTHTQTHRHTPQKGASQQSSVSLGKTCPPQKKNEIRGRSLRIKTKGMCCGRPGFQEWPHNTIRNGQHVHAPKFQQRTPQKKPQTNAESLTLQGGSGSVSGPASPFGYAFAITFALVADYMWYYDEAVGTARSATSTPVFAYGRQACINRHTACATIETQEHSGSRQATPKSGSHC
jgi:hypothetical protein